MAEYGIISADSHFVEPTNIWKERIDKKFREKAPHTVKDLHGKEGEYFVCENITPFQWLRFLVRAYHRKICRNIIKKAWIRPRPVCGIQPPG